MKEDGSNFRTIFFPENNPIEPICITALTSMAITTQTWWTTPQMPSMTLWPCTAGLSLPRLWPSIRTWSWILSRRRPLTLLSILTRSTQRHVLRRLRVPGMDLHKFTLFWNSFISELSLNDWLILAKQFCLILIRESKNTGEAPSTYLLRSTFFDDQLSGMEADTFFEQNVTWTYETSLEYHCPKAKAFEESGVRYQSQVSK